MGSYILYRICYGHTLFLNEPMDPRHESDSSFVSNMKPRFKGSLGILMNVVSDAFFGNKETTFNYTMDSSAVSSGKEDLSGCLLSLSQNKSDIYMIPVPLPLPKANHIDVMGVIVETR